MQESIKPSFLTSTARLKPGPDTKHVFFPQPVKSFADTKQEFFRSQSRRERYRLRRGYICCRDSNFSGR
jgi:hypothetical protein